MQDHRNPIILEGSCKFSVTDPYNDERLLALLDEPTDEEIINCCEKFHIPEFLVDFYKKRKEIWELPHYDICEFGIGIDFRFLACKIYYNIDGHTYSAGTSNKGTIYKYYRPVENYPKPQITKLIGKKESIFEVLSDYKPEYKEYYHNKTFIFFEERISEDIKSLFTVEPNCYHLCIHDLGSKVKENSELIKRLLISHNCNIDNIDTWLNKHDDKIITWIALLENHVSIYYESEESFSKRKKKRT
tara:strand:- start:576 stop:1310 length:735 start_codon:yes stop_codon:yes gene_type:complete